MIDKAIPAGLVGEKLSRVITGTNRVCAGRSAVAAGTGTGVGYLVGCGAATCLKVAGMTTATTIGAPAAASVAAVAGAVALIRSCFE